VALGAKAGGAVTRSRIRRIARTALRSDWALDTRLDLLLMARSEVADRPRRLVRSELTQLLSRLMEAIARIRDTQGSHA
jgi:ribonuclease P protein component